MAEQVGKVTHFFPKVSVAVIKAEKPIKTGDKIKIEGRGKSFEMTIESMEIDREKIESAKKGQEFGLKVPEEVKEGDIVFKA